MLQATQLGGIAVPVVAIPMNVPYEIPEAVRKEIGKYKAAFWDLSGMEGIKVENFFDRYHLDSNGAAMVTAELVKRTLLSREENEY